MVTAVVTPRRGSRIRRIDIDGEPWRTTSRDALDEIRLAEGDPRSPGEIAAALDEAEPACARRRSLALLSRSERTQAGLAERLVTDGYPRDVALAAVAALTSTGLVDDDRFAETAARSLAARGYGRARIVRTLAARGVPDELAAGAASDAAPDDPERAVALARALAPAARGSVDRLAMRLVRRGFSPRDSFAAARAALAAPDAEPPPHLDA